MTNPMQILWKATPTGCKRCFGLGTSSFRRFKRLTGEDAKLVTLQRPKYKNQVQLWVFESAHFAMYQMQLSPGMVRLVLVANPELQITPL